jgi:plastocyanin
MKLLYTLGALALLTPLLGAKCIDYNGDLAAGNTGDLVDAGVTATLPACGDPSEAHIRVQNHSFTNECGCAEATGKTCTVDVGMSVQWTFVDSDEHTVTSVASAFGMSPSLLTGEFQFTFTEPRTYMYFCSNHRSSMSGYQIVVR